MKSDKFLILQQRRGFLLQSYCNIHPRDIIARSLASFRRILVLGSIESADVARGRCTRLGDESHFRSFQPRRNVRGFGILKPKWQAQSRLRLPAWRLGQKCGTIG